MPEGLLQLISKDQNAVLALKAVRDVGPSGAYIAAGFIRNRYWDSLYRPDANRPDVDIDVIYFDKSDADKNRDYDFERTLDDSSPTGMWQVRNQARMHTFGSHPPFTDINDALLHWPETATAVGMRMTEREDLEVIAPFGLGDLYAHVLRISPSMKCHSPDGFEKRLAEKRWQERWPGLTVINA